MKINEDCKRAEHEFTSSKPSQASHTRSVSLHRGSCQRFLFAFSTNIPETCCQSVQNLPTLLYIYTERRLLHSIRSTVTNQDSLRRTVQLKIQIPAIISFKLRTFHLLENTNMMFSRIFHMHLFHRMKTDQATIMTEKHHKRILTPVHVMHSLHPLCFTSAESNPELVPYWCRFQKYCLFC